MGKHLQRKNSGTQFQEHHHHPGCMWGILHMLDYHHWHNLKQKFPYKKYARGRHFRCMGAPKTSSFNFDVDEHQELSESEDDHFLVEQQCNEPISRDTCKGEKHEQWASLGCPEKSWSQENPILLLQKGAEVAESTMNQKLADSEELKKQTLHHQFKDYADVLEVYKVNKETFQKSRQCPDIDAEGNFNGRTKNLKFTKSGSFPVADSRIPSTLQHKINEVWSLPKGDRLLRSTQTPNLVSSRSVKDYCCYAEEKETRSQGWTKLFRNHFRHIKLRIRNAFKDSKNKNQQASSYENGGFEYDRRNDMLGSMRRMSSIDESMEKYVWLFDYSFSREAKLHQQKSLKHGVRPYRRNSSLPDMDSYRSSTAETSHDAPMPIKEPDCPNELHLSEYSDSVVEPMFQWKVVEGGDLEIECLKVDKNKNVEEVAEIEYNRDNINVLMLSKSSALKKNQTCPELNLSKQLTQSVPVPTAETFEELTDSQDAEVNDISTTSPEKIQSINKIADNHILQLNYVRDVLELSGFIGNEYHEAWHCLDQPLNPSLFKELEALLYNRGVTFDDCDHQIMFDLINEVLLDVYKTSLSYFPKALYCNSRISPLPTGLHLLEEVWTRSRQYLSLRPELEGSLDYVVSQDLSGGGWMSLQLETDCIALELEELVFDELLDEVMCSSYC